MKKILFAFITGFSLLMTSCTKNSDEYYVKYVFEYTIGGYTDFQDRDITLTITDEHLNTQTLTLKYSSYKGKEELIYGPFRYGDMIRTGWHNGASLLASAHLSIYVSKNNSPFVLRGTADSPDTPIEYTIDY